ncbi:alkylated DNA repair dioxygenase AlkB [Dyadobacter jejuensis]|uniref:Alkylated DNA repair dioxygenase AlkB n=1 Tax=Dyadobacter jejuensis TaxID=1082580 RepID=A0A316B2P8_9BACT|nr:alpha-ketoglutarate-dependent dioxygenase AlkB [Dyadobacter jejuensis]PWJ56817.1 alkylated DNA repair dioxygenase AlkB [Dyadobacter jejuensis]
MNLFNQDAIPNLLPYEGTVLHYGLIIPSQEAQWYYQRLLETILWKHDEAVMFGKHITTKRMVAWYGDLPFDYTYSKTTKTSLPWTPELLSLKQRVEELTECHYNSCLLNLYHDGSEGMSWHSDDEKALAHHSAIASLSFGAARKFAFKHKVTKQYITTILESGSLIVMKDDTQQNWWHRLPPTKLVKHPRINLTFRTMDVKKT